MGSTAVSGACGRGEVEAGLYFAYGSNMDARQMAVRCPAARLMGAAVVDGFRFALDRRWVAALEACPGARVYGLLWRVTPDCLAALDHWEGVRRDCYRRASLACRPWDGETTGEPREALTYLSCWEGEPLYRKEGYLELVLAAARAAQLPRDYVAGQIEPLLRLPPRRRP